MSRLETFSLGDIVRVDDDPKMEAEVCGYGIVQYPTGVETIVLVRFDEDGSVPQAVKSHRLTRTDKKVEKSS